MHLMFSEHICDKPWYLCGFTCLHFSLLKIHPHPVSPMKILFTFQGIVKISLFSQCSLNICFYPIACYYSFPYLIQTQPLQASLYIPSAAVSVPKASLISRPDYAHRISICPITYCPFLQFQLSVSLLIKQITAFLLWCCIQILPYEHMFLACRSKKNIVFWLSLFNFPLLSRQRRSLSSWCEYLGVAAGGRNVSFESGSIQWARVSWGNKWVRQRGWLIQSCRANWVRKARRMQREESL